MKRDLLPTDRVLQAELQRFGPERPPALLLGGLNLARALGLAGIPVIVASPEDAPAFASRYCAGRCPLPPLADRQAVLATLLAAGRELTEALGVRVPLFYGDDDYLDLVQDCRAELSAYFLLALNEPDIAAALIDKELFQALCESRGLPVPRRIAPGELGGWKGPVLAKPRRKTGWYDSELHERLFGTGKALVFESGAAAAAQPLLAQFAEQLAFQEYLPGDDRALWSFHGFAGEQGELLAWFIGRKIRTHPALTGESSFIELAHDEALAALGREVVARVPLRGAFKIDCKRDARTGRFRLLEVNARFNLWHHLGARNGVNLMQIAYDYLVHGARPKAAPQWRTKYRWLCLPLDWRAFRELSANGELTATEWLGSLAAPMVYDLFAWTDPLPFVRHWSARIRSKLGRKMHRWLATAS